MSSVLRPAGPLPARVYWRRRLTLLLVLLLVVAVFWWLFSALGRSSSAGSDPASTSSAGTGNAVQTLDPRVNRGHLLEFSAPHRPSTGEDPPNSGSAANDEQEAEPKKDREPKQEPEPEPLAEPTGDCAPTEVGMTIDVSDTSVGEPTTATLVLTSRATPACTLAITPASLVLRITTGDVVVWSSDDCPDLLPARQVVVRADPATEYRFEWDGRGSVEGCSPAGPTASPGGYWVEAALVGAEAHRAYFDVVA